MLIVLQYKQEKITRMIAILTHLLTWQTNMHEPDVGTNFWSVFWPSVIYSGHVGEEFQMHRGKIGKQL